MSTCDTNGLIRRLERLERRTSGIEEVTGVVIPGGDGVVDLLVSAYNTESETHTLKWRSQIYQFYRVERSDDLVTWETEEAMVQGADGLATVFTISVPTEDAPVYFRVRALPVSYSPCVLTDDVGDEDIPEDWSIELTGDVTGSGNRMVVTNISNSGVTPGSYTNTNITVGADGRITAASNGTGGGGGGVSQSYVDNADAALGDEIATVLGYVTTVEPAADPTTDMRAAIQTALDAAGAVYVSTGRRQWVQLAAGVYRITTVNSPSSGTKAGGAYGLEIPSGIHFSGRGPGTVLEIHAGGSFGTGCGISPAGMRTATADYGAAENVTLSDFSIAASGAGTDPSSGNLINLVHCQDWAIERVHIGQSYYHGVEIDQSRRIRFSECHWTGPHSYGVSGSWIQFDNGDAGPRSTVPTVRLDSGILVENCSFSRPDTDTGPHGIEMFHNLLMDMRDIVFRGCKFRGQARAFTQIFGIGAGINLDASQFLEGLTIEDCDIEMRHPSAWFINGTQSTGMQMHGIRILNNRFRGNSGRLAWLGGSGGTTYNATQWARTGLEVRGNRYDFTPTDWTLGLDHNFFVLGQWDSVAVEDNTIRCVGDLPAGAGQNYSNGGFKIFSSLDVKAVRNVMTWDGVPVIVSKNFLWIDTQLTDAAGVGYLTNGALSTGATTIAVDTGTGSILAGNSVKIGAHWYLVATGLSAGSFTLTAGLLENIADNSPVTLPVTRSLVVEDNAGMALSGAAWTYGVIVQRGASAPSGSVSRIGGNIGRGMGSPASEVLVTGYAGDLQASLALLAPKASPTFTGPVTVPDASFTLAKLAQSGATTGQAAIWNGTAWTATTLAGGGNALTSNPLSQFAATTSAQIAGVISDETGSGALVFADGSTMSNLTVTGTLSVPDGALAIAKVSGLQLALDGKQSSLTLGTGVSTALSGNVGSSGAFVVNGGALGTPSSGDLTNCTFPTLNQSTTGNAATATKLATARTIAMTGDVTWSISFDGSGNASGTGTIANGAVTGAKMAQSGATPGQAWVWNGTAWAPATVSGGGGLSYFTEAQESTYNSSVPIQSFTATAAGSHIGVAIVPKGNGAFMLSVPDGTSTGGNVRGSLAVDIQTTRGAADQVGSGANTVTIGGRNKATGQYSTGIGYSNTVSGFSSALSVGWNNVSSNTNSITIGDSCTASYWVCLAMGRQAVASRAGQIAWSSGAFSAAGDNQISSFHLAVKTTDATPTEVAVKTVFSSTDRISIAAGMVMTGILTIHGMKSDGSSVASYCRKFTIKRVGSTTTLVSSSTVGTDDAAGTAISITADDTNDRLSVFVTGIASETWRWTGRIDAVETAYGT